MGVPWLFRLARNCAATRAPANLDVPGFFSTLRGAMSDIPSSQPVTDELSWIIDFNERVRRLRAIIDSARPHVSELVTKVVTASFERPISTQELRAWREQVNSQVARDAGFAYQAYVRLKLASVRAFGAQLIVKLRGRPAQSPLARVVAEIIDAWALAKGIVYERVDSAALEFETATTEHFPAWVNYLLAFDVKYRERRLHFLIEGQNRLYGLLDQERFAGLNPQGVDRLKREFYLRLDALRRREDPSLLQPAGTRSHRRHLSERPIGQRGQESARLCGRVRGGASREDRSPDRAARRRDQSRREHA